MAYVGKRYKASAEKIDREKKYTIDEALSILKELPNAKFDETVDLAVRLGVNPKHADQMVRGACLLPHGTGKVTRVLVFAKGEKVREALDAGADFAGGEEYIEKIKGGWLEFDKVVATPDVMSIVGKIGKILGTRGLMPNPKVGTVTVDVTKAVKDLKGGKVEFKVEKTGIIHTVAGKKSFSFDALRENILTIIETLIKLKPPSAKGTYLKSVAFSTTMGPGFKLDPVQIETLLKKSPP
ncbi:MAG: 50S ribosomal protein L1, partial [Deltaproteobacteria bacterium]|nr:50S ribosomal protein L1 [Deltaproteobacteria bacterium]